jgi:hypothetical protein
MFASFQLKGARCEQAEWDLHPGAPNCHESVTEKDGVATDPVQGGDTFATSGNYTYHRKGGGGGEALSLHTERASRPQTEPRLPSPVVNGIFGTILRRKQTDDKEYRANDNEYRANY